MPPEAMRQILLGKFGFVPRGHDRSHYRTMQWTPERLGHLFENPHPAITARVVLSRAPVLLLVIILRARYGVMLQPMRRARWILRESSQLDRLASSPGAG